MSEFTRATKGADEIEELCQALAEGRAGADMQRLAKVMVDEMIHRDNPWADWDCMFANEFFESFVGTCRLALPQSFSPDELGQERKSSCNKTGASRQCVISDQDCVCSLCRTADAPAQ